MLRSRHGDRIKKKKENSYKVVPDGRNTMADGSTILQRESSTRGVAAPPRREERPGAISTLFSMLSKHSAR